MVKTTLIKHHLNNTLYELWKYRKPNISYCKAFGCKCYILNTKDNLGKFDPKFDVGIFLGYLNTSKTYWVYNKRTLIVKKFILVIFDESNSSAMEKVVVDDDVDEKLEEDSSKDSQKNAPLENQEEQHEETNAG